MLSQSRNIAVFTRVNQLCDGATELPLRPDKRLCNLSRSMRIPALPLRSFLLKILSANSPPPGLPQFTPAENTLNSLVAPIFDQIPEPSQEVSAILWALETSTDPQLAESAAAIVPDLQWPIGLTLHSGPVGTPDRQI